jgi:small subunit ribosomal protein S20
MITNEKQRVRNRTNRAQMRSSVKAFRTLADTEKDQAAAQLPSLYSTVDVQARKGIIPRKRASRLKSRLAALVQK